MNAAVPISLAASLLAAEVDASSAFGKREPVRLPCNQCYSDILVAYKIFYRQIDRCFISRI